MSLTFRSPAVKIEIRESLDTPSGTGWRWLPRNCCWRRITVINPRAVAGSSSPHCMDDGGFSCDFNGAYKGKIAERIAHAEHQRVTQPERGGGDYRARCRRSIAADFDAWRAKRGITNSSVTC